MGRPLPFDARAVEGGEGSARVQYSLNKELAMGALGDFLLGDEFDKCMKTIRKYFGLDLHSIAKRLPKSEYENGRAELIKNIRINRWNSYEAAVMGSRLFFIEMVVARDHMVHIDRTIVQWAAAKKISTPVFSEYMVAYLDLKKKFDLQD